jgi:hypothetical protein
MPRSKRVFQKLIVGPSPSETAQGTKAEVRRRRVGLYRGCRPTKPWGFAAGRSQSNFIDTL